MKLKIYKRYNIFQVSTIFLQIFNIFQVSTIFLQIFNIFQVSKIILEICISTLFKIKGSYESR